MSWQLVAILFAISAFEGVGRLGPEDVVMRCGPLGAWRVVVPTRLWRDWHLVSILPPFFITIVIAADFAAADKKSSSDRHLPQFTRSSWPVLALRFLGALEFVILIFGIPWGVSRFGAAGFFTFLGAALVLGVEIALCSATLLIRERASRRIAVRKAISLLSPFAAPTAAEVVLGARLRRYPRLTTISGLLGEAEFHELVRRSAYDVESAATTISGPWLEIARSLSHSERALILRSAADGCTALERYCPRCGEKYLLESSVCSECDGVALNGSSADGVKT